MRAQTARQQKPKPPTYHVTAVQISRALSMYGNSTFLCVALAQRTKETQKAKQTQPYKAIRARRSKGPGL
jgi:hypothetical protein